jgi:hypothetical protein
MVPIIKKAAIKDIDFFKFFNMFIFPLCLLIN